MARRLIDADRLEGVEPNVQSDVSELHARRLDGLEQRRREMQSRGGSGRRTVSPGIDGLVTAGVLKPLLDVGRSRHLADPLHLVHRLLRAKQPYPPGSTGQGFQDLRAKLRSLERDPAAV